MPQMTQEYTPQNIHFAKFSGGTYPTTTLAGAFYAAAIIDFVHKLGNHLPQILDLPLDSIAMRSRDVCKDVGMVDRNVWVVNITPLLFE